MGFSFEKGNLYQHENITAAKESYKEKRDRVLDNLIDSGKSARDPDEKEKYRGMLRDKIKEGFIDREYLSKYGWDETKILMTNDIVDFLLPPLKSIEKEEAEQPIVKHIKETILITNGGSPETGSGVGWEEKRLIPRFELLVDFFKENGIATNRYFCYQGENKPEMMRGESYIMFVVPDLNKMVFLCDEEGNATYIIHNAPTNSEFKKLMQDEEIEESERQPQFYYRMSKNELQDLKNEFEIISSVKWDEEKWLEKISEELTRNINFTVTFEDINNFLNQSKQQREENDDINKASVNWITNGALAVKLDIDHKIIRLIAEKYLINNKDWSKQFIDNTGRLRQHYSPELAEIIRKELSERKNVPHVPANWITNKALASKIGFGERIIRLIAEKYLINNKDWSKQFIDNTGRLRQHYSPELAEIIRKELSERKDAPLGWITNGALAYQFGVDFKTVKRIADRYLKNNKDWSEQFRDSMGRIYWHYSPELVEIIKKELLDSKK